MIYLVSHVTQLNYAQPVADSRFNLRLVPRAFAGHVLQGHKLVITPEPVSRQDRFGPYWVNTTQIGFGKPLKEIQIASEFTIEVPQSEPGSGDENLEHVRRAALEVHDLGELAPAPYLFASRLALSDREIAEWGAIQIDGEAGIFSAASALMAAINGQFAYAPGTTTSSTLPGEAFAARGGVCQDFAHIMIIALRSQGIPAAYVSGYLRTLAPPGKEKLVGADAMHAWVNVWCGNEKGWIGFDPTNNCLAQEDHIPIAMGRDYADVSPIDGTFLGSSPQKMKSAVNVQPLV